jgi:hypothetical protein
MTVEVMPTLRKTNQRLKPKQDRQDMRPTPRSRPLTPASPQRQSVYGADANNPQRASPALPQLNRQDSYTANPYETKRLPEVPNDSGGRERGRVEQAVDQPATDDGHVAEVERLRQENATLKEQWSLAAMELNSFRSEKTYERDDSYFIEVQDFEIQSNELGQTTFL